VVAGGEREREGESRARRPIRERKEGATTTTSGAARRGSARERDRERESVRVFSTSTQPGWRRIAAQCSSNGAALRRDHAAAPCATDRPISGTRERIDRRETSLGLASQPPLQAGGTAESSPREFSRGGRAFRDGELGAAESRESVASSDRRSPFFPLALFSSPSRSGSSIAPGRRVCIGRRDEFARERSVRQRPLSTRARRESRSVSKDSLNVSARILDILRERSRARSRPAVRRASAAIRSLRTYPR